MNVNKVSQPDLVLEKDSHPETLTEVELLALKSAPGEVANLPPRAVNSINGSSDLQLKYDANAIALYYQSRPVRLLKRIFKVLAPTVAFAFGVWWDGKRGVKVKNDVRRAIQFRKLLTKLGPAYIKIGQALSTRPDLVPVVYLEELTQLQDKLPAFPNEIAYQFIEEELGHKPHEVYAEISPQPIAAASLSTLR